MMKEIGRKISENRKKLKISQRENKKIFSLFYLKTLSIIVLFVGSILFFKCFYGII